MHKNMVVTGGGIGGLAAALACARAGWRVDLLEQSPVFGEVGAGIQLGPNVVKVLRTLGLENGLRRVAAYPAHLEVRNAITTERLAVLPGADGGAPLWRPLCHHCPRRHAQSVAR